MDLSKKKEKEILALYKSKMALNDISDKLNVPRWKVENTIYRKYEVKKVHKKKLCMNEVNLIKSLYQKNSIPKMAEITGLSMNRIEYIKDAFDLRKFRRRTHRVFEEIE